MQGGGLADGSERVYGFGVDQMHRFAAQPVMTTSVQRSVWCTVADAVAAAYDTRTAELAARSSHAKTARWRLDSVPLLFVRGLG